MLLQVFYSVISKVLLVISKFYWFPANFPKVFGDLFQVFFCLKWDRSQSVTVKILSRDPCKFFQMHYHNFFLYFPSTQFLLKNQFLVCFSIRRSFLSFCQVSLTFFLHFHQRFFPCSQYFFHSPSSVPHSHHLLVTETTPFSL